MPEELIRYTPELKAALEAPPVDLGGVTGAEIADLYETVKGAPASDPEPQFTLTIGDGENPTSADAGEEPMSEPDGTWRIEFAGLDSVVRFYLRKEPGASIDGVRLDASSGNGLSLQGIDGGSAATVATIGGNGFLDGGKTIWVTMDTADFVFYDADPQVGSPTPILSVDSNDFQAADGGNGRSHYPAEVDWAVFVNGTPTEIPEAEFTPATATAPTPGLEADVAEIEANLATQEAFEAAYFPISGGSSSVIAPEARPVVWFPGAASLRGLGGLARSAYASAAGRLGTKPVLTVSGHSFGRQAELAQGVADALDVMGMYGGGQFVSLLDNAKDRPFGGVTATFAGTWSDADGYGASGGLSSKVNTGAAGATCTVDATGDDYGLGIGAVRVLFNRASGAGSVEVYSSPDGVTFTLQGTVDTSGAAATNHYEDVEMPTGTEAFRIAVTGASVAFPGGVGYFGARAHGIEVWRGGNGGSQIVGTTGDPTNPTQLGTRTEADWADVLGAIGPCACLLALGYNSLKNGQENNSTSGAVIVADAVAEQAAHVSAYGVPCLVLAETASEPGYTGSDVSTAIQEAYAARLYANVQAAAASGDPVGLLDAERLVTGDRAAAAASPNFWDDGVHPSIEGGRDVGFAVVGALFG